MSSTRTGRRWKRLMWVLSALVLVAVVAWRAGAWNPTNAGVVSRTGDGQRGLDIRPGLDLYPQDQRVKAPTLEGTTLDGKPFALSDLAGKIVVINVWGSWCAPCRAETPDLVRLAREDADRGVRFVGIDTRDNPAAAKAFVRSFRVPYPSIQDPQGQVLLSGASRLTRRSRTRPHRWPVSSTTGDPRSSVARIAGSGHGLNDVTGQPPIQAGQLGQVTQGIIVGLLQVTGIWALIITQPQVLVANWQTPL